MYEIIGNMFSKVSSLSFENVFLIIVSFAIAVFGVIFLIKEGQEDKLG